MNRLRPVGPPKPPAKDPAGRPPPHDLDAERFVLEQVLGRGDVRPVKDLLGVQDFFAQHHSALFAAALELDARGTDAGYRAVRALLHDQGKLSRLEMELLDELRQQTFAEPRGLEDAARRVAELAHRRRVLGELWRALAEGYGDVGDYRIWVRDFAATVSRVAAEIQQRGDVPIAIAVAEAVAEANTARARAEAGRPVDMATGFSGLDAETAGLHRAELTVVTGITGRGKSAFAGCLAANVARTGIGVQIFQLEDTRSKYSQRLGCAYGCVNAHQLRAGTLSPEDHARYLQTCDWIASQPLRIDDTKNLSPVDIEGRARRASEKFTERGATLGVVIVDYLQLLNGRPLVGERENRERELFAVALELLRIAERLQVAVVALSQLNDQGEVRESRAIIHHAQNHWEVQRKRQGDAARTVPGVPREPEPVVIRIRKQRHGPFPVNVPIWFHPEFVLFSDEERPS